ncbi:thiamine-phosphate kinase [Sulfuricystis thermophila]|uniref:thiamine-phosphate kinase n=1 Tax=Sulfuricystis thermophila TaxID=2496847 RepID=UPI001036DB92|nr:thiamine-phosphate kinase [Sulfuricystis thermophila]
MPSEFELIDRYFRRPPHHAVLGVGDDAAIVRPSPGCELVISTDMLVAGTHFFADDDPEALGWKTLAVNVSDIAAMGAQPRWAVIAAALPTANEAWLEKFASGLFDCADAFGIDIVGGDTTRGPRNFCVTIFGEVPQGMALLRSGAHLYEEIWVSGMPGRAALGLAHLQGRIELTEPALSVCLAALHRPQPRLELGLALRGLASAAIDVSDGLLADLGHLLEASRLAATLRLELLPASGPEREAYLAGGDDYELIFTASPEHHAAIEGLSERLGLPLTCIGKTEAGEAGRLTVLDASGEPVEVKQRGYDHFA